MRSPAAVNNFLNSNLTSLNANADLNTQTVTRRISPGQKPNESLLSYEQHHAEPSEASFGGNYSRYAKN